MSAMVFSAVKPSESAYLNDRALFKFPLSLFSYALPLSAMPRCDVMPDKEVYTSPSHSYKLSSRPCKAYSQKVASLPLWRISGHRPSSRQRGSVS